MPHDPNAALFDDEGDADLAALAGLVRRECDALSEVLPGALSAQWRAAPAPKPRDDTTERGKGSHGDPTQAIVLDERRLRLRLQVIASERVLRGAAVAVRGVRRGLELALDEWEGRPRADQQE